jgi:hypothetical protein
MGIGDTPQQADLAENPVREFYVKLQGVYHLALLATRPIAECLSLLF